MRTPFDSTSRRSGRRGVTLLFVIGLITLFVLLGTTFLVVSVHYLRGSRIHNTGRIQWDDPRDQQRTVLYRVLGGTNDTQSSLLTHGLMTDMYDVNETFFGFVNTAYYPNDPATPPNGVVFSAIPGAGVGPGMILMQVTPTVDLRLQAYQLSTTTGAYNGQYLTFLDGPTKGTTVHILDYLVYTDPNNANQVVQQFVVRPTNSDLSAFNLVVPSANVNAGGLVGARILINSRQFNGKGVGFPVNNNRALTNPQLARDALLPNRRDYYRANVDTPYQRVAPRDLIQFYYGDGHANETYDAVDFQNMFLAAMPTYPNGDLDVVPSFHRPSLVRFWRNNSLAAVNPVGNGSATNNDPSNYAPFLPQHQTDWDPANNLYPLTYREFRRQVIMRPMPWDHPNFSGGNPNLIPIDTDGDGSVWDPGLDMQPGIANFDDDGFNGPDDPGELGFPGSDDVLDNDTQLLEVLDGTNGYVLWDVDNDGDLIPDSVWIDVGLPVQVDASGRHYKPLAAVLITDLDGRFNINANGSRWHQDGQYGTMAIPSNTTDPSVTTDQINERGQGYGPPEVSMRTIFTTNNEYRRLLFGASFGTATPDRLVDWGQGLSGRYGADQDITAGQNVEPAPGRAIMDPLAQVEFAEYPPSWLGGAYGSLSDPKGRIGIGLDGNGQPVFDVTNQGLEIGNSDYEMNLSHDGPRGAASGFNSADQPFATSELERVLRGHDGSNGALPDRLWRLSPTLQTLSNNARLLVTTDSYDVPVPHESMFVRGSIVEELRWQLGLNDNGSVRAGTFAQQLQINGATPIQIVNAINAEIRELTAHEWLRGNRMDANRPFGNGQDDNGNGVIDEAWFIADFNISEAYFQGSILESATTDGTPAHNPNLDAHFDHDNDGRLPNDPQDLGALARYKYAQALYLMMYMLVDQNTTLDFDGDGIPTVAETPYALAQYAINVVDFRDRDSIMTPFEFDLNPFNADAWGVNGDLSNNNNEPDRAVVWGTERPELLISEAFATHDRRAENLPDYGTYSGRGRGRGLGRDDYDQRLRPEGALFLEFYNPWTNSTAAPAELYGSYNGATGVDLRRTDLSGQFPVWRVMVAKPDNPVGPANNPDPEGAIRGRFSTPNDTFLDPDLLNPNNNLRMNTNNIERTIYFTDFTPGAPGLDNGDRAYVPSTTVFNALRPIPPLNYAVIGPEGRQVSPTQYVTPFGRRTDVDELASDFKYDQTRSIWLNPGQSVRRIQPSLTNPIAMHTVDRPAMAVPIPFLSISEPTGGYPVANFDPNGAGGEGEYMPPADVPFDQSNVNPELENMGDGTHRAYRMVYLQRLANPLAPFDANTNPYMTIDSAHVDLTIFHGAEDRPVGLPPLPPPAMGQPPQSLPDEYPYEFATNERGADEVGTPGLPYERSRNLWGIETQLENVTDSYRNTGDQHVFDRHLFESVGYLNDVWRPRNDDNQAHVEGPRDLQTAHARTNLQGTQHYDKWRAGEPSEYVAFPWLTFNNRPFISQLEMTMVPKSRPSRMLYDFTLQTATAVEYEANKFDTRFGHLANFFSTSVDPTGPPDDPNGSAPHLYRLFDFVHVPSRFVQTDEQLIERRTDNISEWIYTPYQQLIAEDTNGTQVGVLPYNAPFNYVSERREPGKININTIYDQRIWEGVMGNLGGGLGRWPGPTWQQFVDSRRGYGTGQPILQGNASVPTIMGVPYRDGGAGNLVVENTGMSVFPSVYSTLLRPQPNNPNNPLYDSTTNFDYNDADRNSYFKEHSRFRLGNLLTTRSNVYAVWITIGHFEFDPVTQQLGQELGADTGNIQRHRSFHIFDRSIPVGYEPGENHNIDKAILVERFIE